MSIEAMKQPEALRLADEIMTSQNARTLFESAYDAAAELRRLHEENERLKAVIAEAEKQEPVAWMRDDEMKAMVAIEKQAWIEAGQAELVEDYNKQLYTSPPQRQPLTDEMKAQAKRAYPHNKKRELSFIDGWLSCESTQAIAEAEQEPVVEGWCDGCNPDNCQGCGPAAKMNHEPIFWYRPVGEDGGYEGPIHNGVIEKVLKLSGVWKPLYTSPPPRQPLTEEQIVELDKWLAGVPFWRVLEFTRAIEAAHRIGEKK